MLTTKNLLNHLVNFSHDLKYKDLPPEVVHEAKRRLIDSMACAIAGSHDPATLLLAKNSCESMEEKAFRFTHLIRVLDWNDTYLSKEPAHPSDNIGALLALCNYGISGEDFITAMVLAYEIQCRFCDAASLRKNGWDHVAYVSLATAFATAKILKLNREKMTHAASLALRWIPLRQVRAGSDLSMSKGLSAAEAVKFGVHSAQLANCGITGPSEMMEGQFGFINQATGELDFSAFTSLGSEFKILKTHIKLYPVEYHAQAAVDVALQIRKTLNGRVENITRLDLESYEACRAIIADKNKRRPATKESADHSLFYIMAVTLLDGEMTLKQYAPERYNDPAVLQLIDKMSDVQETPKFNEAYLNREKPAFPLRCKVIGYPIPYTVEVEFPKGHFANPLTDDELVEKFKALTSQDINPVSLKSGLEYLWHLEDEPRLAPVKF
ncbi:MAG: MmgE/PrpD family protein [bacterium]|nr:MmgE/PrpD family protein [bacterium]